MAASSHDTPNTARYRAEDRAFVIEGGPWFGNRPLYGDHRAFAVLAGDRPLLRVISGDAALGTVLLGAHGPGGTLWLFEASSVTSRYDSGAHEWHVRDPRIGPHALSIGVVMTPGRDGFTVKASGLQNGTSVIVAVGGPHPFEGGEIFWHADPALHPLVYDTAAAHQRAAHIPGLNELAEAFDPATADGSVVSLASRQARVSRASTGATLTAIGPSAWHNAPANEWHTASQLLASRLNPVTPCDLAVAELIGDDAIVAFTIDGHGLDESPAELHEAGVRRVQALRRTVIVNSPDAQLNAAVPAAVAALDALWYPPKVVHGAMAWNTPLLGWRSFYGFTAVGWGDRVTQAALHYLASQVKEGDDPADVGTDDAFTEGPKVPGRFNRGTLATGAPYAGPGRIREDQQFYNMQTVFFDQLCHAWQATHDPALEEALRPALEAHLAWYRRCFDPQDIGVYESYLDIWASDSLWYAGGATPHASAYAYRGHAVAAELADRAGLPTTAANHRARAAMISTAMMTLLWSDSTRAFGEYREPGVGGRLHDEASISALAIPIDCGAVDTHNAASLIDYSVWALRRQPGRFGGEWCWTTNWVPREWSVRQVDLADQYHLALAAFRSGLPEHGWQLLQAGFRETAFDGLVPGGVPCEPQFSDYPSTDFADAVSMYVRTVVEGLFGVHRRGGPAGVVQWTPGIPAEWSTFTATVDGVTVEFWRDGHEERYRVSAPGATRVSITAPVRSGAEIELPGASIREGWGAARVTLSAEGSALEFTLPYDPLFTGTERRADQTPSSPSRPAPSDVTRHHRGSHSWLSFTSAHSPLDLASSLGAAHDRTWRALDLSDLLNDELGALFDEVSASDESGTVSARLGVDGFSPWTYPFWGIAAPRPSLDRVAGSPSVQVGDVLYSLASDDKNVAVVSTLDRWPVERVVPIDARGDAVALLMVSTSTWMQTGIANAAVTLHYADGTETEHQLEHPRDLWSITGNYDRDRDGDVLGDGPPTVMLGENTRATSVLLPLIADKAITGLTLRALSPEVSVGILALSVRENSVL